MLSPNKISHFDNDDDTKINTLNISCYAIINISNTRHVSRTQKKKHTIRNPFPESMKTDTTKLYR